MLRPQGPSALLRVLVSLVLVALAAAIWSQRSEALELRAQITELRALASSRPTSVSPALFAALTSPASERVAPHPYVPHEPAPAASNALPEDLDPELTAQDAEHAADAHQLAARERERTRLREISESLEARRLAGVVDQGQYRRVRTIVERENVHLAGNSSDDGCSQDICSVRLDVSGSLDGTHDALGAPLYAEGFRSYVVVRLADDDVRLYATRPGIPLVAPPTNPTRR